jgi:hypothetical protein
MTAEKNISLMFPYFIKMLLHFGDRIYNMEGTGGV